MRRVDAEQSLDELEGLAHAAGATTVVRALQERATPDSATFIGRGKAQALALACAEAAVDVVIVDNELTPAQLRELQDLVACKVIDRTQLILDIFARRARTREGKLQVELAQLKYLLPRLVGASAALSRLGGGIGTRGPGETKLEMDRRRIRTRISVAQRRDRAGAPAPRPAARAPRQGDGADHRAGRLHQRRQDHALQPADPRRRAGLRRAVRHPRSAGAPGAAARRPRAAAVRHRRLHRSAAARAGGGLPRHARGGGRRRSAAARHRRLAPGSRPDDRGGDARARERRRARRAAARGVQQGRPAARRRAFGARAR